MLTDPQIITINAIAKSLARISQDGSKTIYQKDDETVKLTIGHTRSNRRVRSMSRVDLQAVVVDPLTEVSDYDTATIYAVIDRPEKGFTVAAIQDLVTGYTTWLNPTMVAKLMGGES